MHPPGAVLAHSPQATEELCDDDDDDDSAAVDHMIPSEDSVSWPRCD